MATSVEAPDSFEIHHEFVEANGLRFHVASCGDGDRLALCLHGFPECWYSWRLQLPLLARLGYKAWAPDLRGYNTSSRPARLDDYAIEHLLADVAGLIDASAARTVVLLAHDWGALIAWYFAIRQVRPLEGLVIMNVPHPEAARPAFRRWKQRRKSWYALFFQIPWLPERLLSARNYQGVARAMVRSAVHPERFPEQVQQVYRESAAQPGAATAMINYYRAFMRGGAKRQRALGTPVIDTRTLMVWGEQDIALSIETTFGTQDWVSDLTLRYLPDASHWVQQDDPDTTNLILEAWLTGKPVPGSATPAS